MVTYFNRNEKVFPVYAYSFDSPIKLELNIKGLFNTFNNELAKLQANATRFELLVTPSKNSAAYLVDIATGIEIPYVFYEKVQNNKYVLKQKGRTDNAKDKYIKFCIFKELEKEEVISSQEIIEGYIKDNNTIENYNRLLALANENQYSVDNPNSNKQNKKENILNNSEMDSFSTTANFLKEVTNISSLISEIPIEIQKKYYNILDRILNDYDELYKLHQGNIDRINFEMLLNRMIELKDELQKLKEKEVINNSFNISDMHEFLKYIENYSDSREKLCLLYEKLSELQEDNLTDNIAEQIEIVELVSTKILSLLLEISSKERAEYIDKLNNTFTEEIISILEKTIRNKDIVMGMHFTSEDTERKKYLGKLISFNN